MTVEELLQELVELCQRGRAQWEVRSEDLYLEDGGTIQRGSSTIRDLELHDDKKEVILV